jgi:hypothetical protein
MNSKNILLVTIFIINFQKVEAQTTGENLDPNKCIRSAGYVWSDLKKDCIRAFELPTQLIQKDNSYFASVLFSATADTVEVFSKEGKFLLTRKKKNYFIGTYDEISFFLEKIIQNGQWGKLNPKRYYIPKNRLMENSKHRWI